MKYHARIDEQSSTDDFFLELNRGPMRQNPNNIKNPKNTRKPKHFSHNMKEKNQEINNANKNDAIINKRNEYLSQSENQSRNTGDQKPLQSLNQNQEIKPLLNINIPNKSNQSNNEIINNPENTIFLNKQQQTLSPNLHKNNNICFNVDFKAENIKQANISQNRHSPIQRLSEQDQEIKSSFYPEKNTGINKLPNELSLLAHNNGNNRKPYHFEQLENDVNERFFRKCSLPVNNIPQFSIENFNRERGTSLVSVGKVNVITNTNVDRNNHQNISPSNPGQRKRYVNTKTQTPSKKSLEVSDSITIDYYYNKIISFDVDQKSLQAHIRKRTRHHKKRNGEMNKSLNFIKKYIPINDISDETLKASMNNITPNFSKELNYFATFDDQETENIWEETLNRYRSIKSTKAMFNTIRISEYKNNLITKIKDLTNEYPKNENPDYFDFSSFSSLLTCLNNSHNSINSIDSPNFHDSTHIEKFPEILNSLNLKNTEDTDKLHLFAWHQYSIDPKKIIENLDKFARNHPNHAKCVMHYLVLWVSHFPLDFLLEKISNSIPSREIVSLIDYLIAKNRATLNFIKNAMTIRAAIYFLNLNKVSPQMFSHYPSLKPKIVQNPADHEFSRLIDLQIEPIVLVSHITYSELAVFRSISRSDIIVYSNWGKSNGLQQLFQRFNITCSFILSSIVKFNKDDQLQRTLYWINTMSAAEKYRNYNLMYEIEAALSSPLMKQNLGEIGIAQITKFEKMKSFLASKRYKESILKNKEMCVPFFGLILSEIAKKFKKCQNDVLDLRITEELMVNIELFFSQWGTQYTFDLNSTILNLVNNYDGRITSLDELKNVEETFINGNCY